MSLDLNNLNAISKKLISDEISINDLDNYTKDEILYVLSFVVGVARGARELLDKK
ncbi:hypothetical protein SDC9_171721 [bioreactor metagenome]|uniref:Uncharacterized protein n=1 Tax=bioreactor metagenome TaxID=1076179 RepID=A0A645GK59_9ZZZZ